MFTNNLSTFQSKRMVICYMENNCKNATKTFFPIRPFGNFWPTKILAYLFGTFGTSIWHSVSWKNLADLNLIVFLK